MEITWAQTNCNFQNLAGRKKTYVRHPEIPRVKLTARIWSTRVYIFWLPVSFLTNKTLGNMVAEFQHTAASCPCWRPDFKTMTFRIQYFSTTTCQNDMHIMNKSWWKMLDACIARICLAMKPPQTPFGNFPIPRPQQTLQNKNLKRKSDTGAPIWNIALLQPLHCIRCAPHSLAPL